MPGVEPTHLEHVQELLAAAAAQHLELLSRLPPEIQGSLPVDAQGLTRAIDYLADQAGLSEGERRALIRPHAINPAVLHARIFGGEQLGRETVISSFVEGARVRADALGALADAIGGEALGQAVRTVLVEHPPPLATDPYGVDEALRATYEAQERGALLIASALDAGA